MKMYSAGIGIGLGVKDFRGIFIFTERGALDRFVEEGWQAGGQADAAAKAGEKGAALTGAIDVAPGIKLYQITEHGLALMATIQGTKFWKDDELTDEETIDLGDPVWKKDSQTPTDQAPYAGGTDAQLVKSIQSGLADMGYDPGPVDNIMGPRTAAALRQYQAIIG